MTVIILLYIYFIIGLIIFNIKHNFDVSVDKKLKIIEKRKNCVYNDNMSIFVNKYLRLMNQENKIKKQQKIINYIDKLFIFNQTIRLTIKLMI